MAYYDCSLVTEWKVNLNESQESKQMNYRSRKKKRKIEAKLLVKNKQTKTTQCLFRPLSCVVVCGMY